MIIVWNIRYTSELRATFSQCSSKIMKKQKIWVLCMFLFICSAFDIIFCIYYIMYFQICKHLIYLGMVVIYFIFFYLLFLDPFNSCRTLEVEFRASSFFFNMWVLNFFVLNFKYILFITKEERGLLSIVKETNFIHFDNFSSVFWEITSLSIEEICFYFTLFFFWKE